MKDIPLNLNCYATLGSDQPYSFANYEKIGGYSVWREILEKKTKPEDIIERVKAYVSGIIAGVVAGLINYYRNPKQSYALCTFIAIVYLVKLGVYYFYPKSPLMLYSLKTKEQTDAWAKIYEEMKNRYKISLVIGFVGYIVLFRGL